MKLICKHCGLEKPAAEFSFHGTKGSGFQDECKPCHSILNRAHYEGNKDYYVTKAASSRADRVPELIELVEKLFPGACSRCDAPITFVSARRVYGRGEVPARISFKSMALTGWSAERIRDEFHRCVITCIRCYKAHQKMQASARPLPRAREKQAVAARRF